MIKIRLNAAILATGILVLGAAIVCGYLYLSDTVVCQGAHQWLNPAFRCGKEPAIRKASYLLFEDELERGIDAMRRQGAVDEVSIFFRDLENGPTFGINHSEEYIPASLLKVPLMLTYYRLADEDPSILRNVLVNEGAVQVVTPSIPPSEALQEGEPYTVEELIRRMIVHSDNQAWILLARHLMSMSSRTDLLGETYAEIGLLEQSDDVATETLSAKSYAGLFRLLYNASYLSHAMSNKALALLADAEYALALRAGVPDDIPVAHKFGERQFLDTGLYQLHDCGIVYYPENPYLLCIMTKGRDPAALPGVIAKISRLVYEEVNSRKF
jgi:beta-lactamase class A